MFKRLSFPHLEYVQKLIVGTNRLESPITAVQNIVVAENGPNTLLDFRNLQWVGSMDANISAGIGGVFTPLPAINLPALAGTLGPISNLNFSSNTFTAMQLPSIMSVNGSLTIGDNKFLFDLQLPNLQTVASGLTIQNNPSLSNFTANALEHASSIHISGKSHQCGVLLAQGCYRGF